MGSFLKEMRSFLHPHYVMNIALAVSFFVLKTTTPFCYSLFDDCSLELREFELLTFLGCIIVLKNRKQPSYKVYVSTVCMFAKILNALLYSRQNAVLGVVYILICVLHLVFLPEPAYRGPDYVTYFRGSILEEEIKRDPRVTWLVEFYAAWSPACVNFANTFAELSAKYSLDNLKFGKLDVTRYGDISDRFRVNSSSWSKQLPTLILFQNGKESKRRPVINAKAQVSQKFVFSEENVIRDFELNELYHQCKKNPIKKKDRKRDLEVPSENGHATEGVENGKPKME